jgi:putative endonuclease
VPTPRSKLGTAGEQAARRYLEQHGLTWIENNWRCPSGEFDLVMRDATELVFVEVKVRHGESAGRAEEGITFAKCKKLLAAGAAYVQVHPDVGDLIWRIDLVAITLDRSGKVERITHIENAIVTG